jgi:hypothetical protein
MTYTEVAAFELAHANSLSPQGEVNDRALPHTDYGTGNSGLPSGTCMSKAHKSVAVDA